jgi:transcriptional regulator NrdR family protein
VPAPTAPTTTCDTGESCQHDRTKVIDSRKGRYRHTKVRRRRECLDCSLRFTTIEISNENFNSIASHEFELWVERKISSARTFSPNRTA